MANQTSNQLQVSTYLLIVLHMGNEVTSNCHASLMIPQARPAVLQEGLAQISCNIQGALYVSKAISATHLNFSSYSVNFSSHLMLDFVYQLMTRN